MLEIIDRLDRWQAVRRSLEGQSVGFVPTMGALHHGHGSLLERSVAENDVTVLSVFVNPTQFDQAADLNGYPRTLESDRQLAEGIGVTHLLFPRYDDVYPDDYAYKVSENSFSRHLCGAHRDGHFDGVLTVVMKLLNLVRPHKAYFGEKDYQQLELVRGMAEAFFLDVEIVGCPTVRETDGLAASSRNLHLTPEERRLAAEFPRLLGSPLSPPEIISRLEKQGFRVDFIEERRGRRFGAVHLGEVRLIDNIALADIPVSDFAVRASQPATAEEARA